MEEKIKRLTAMLQELFATIDTGQLGFWAVGEEMIWKVDSPGEGGSYQVFAAEKRKGQIIISAAKIEPDRRISVGFRIAATNYEKLKKLAEDAGKSQTRIIEEFIENA